MRVLCLMTDAFGGRGGIAQYNRDFLAALSGIENVEKAVVLPRLIADSVFQLPAKVIQLQPSLNPLAYSVRALLTALRYGPFDIIFCGHIRMCALAWLLAKLVKKPFWLQIHGIEAWENPTDVQEMFVRKAALILSVSRFSRKKIISWAAVDPQTVKVLPNAVDISRFKPGPKSESLLQQWGVKNCQVLLTVSRLDTSERRKGHALVIHAMPELLKKFPKLRYVIAGTGSDQSFLERLVQKNNLQNEVILVGQVEEALKPDLYRLADAFVMPSKKEGFGIVFLEALASGIPVIAGNKDGSVDPLRDGENGCLVDPDNLQDLIGAIEKQLLKTKNEIVAASTFSFSNFKKYLSTILALNRQ